MHRTSASSSCTSSSASCSYNHVPQVLVRHISRRAASRYERLPPACSIRLNKSVFAALVGQERPTLQILTAPTQPSIHDSANGDHFSIDILGIGQAMVDINALASEELLAKLEIARGGRRWVLADASEPNSVEESGNVVQIILWQTQDADTRCV